MSKPTAYKKKLLVTLIQYNITTKTSFKESN